MSLGVPPGPMGMTMTTKVLSVSVPVTDQDAALKFYTEVLGCELRTDVRLARRTPGRGRPSGLKRLPGAAATRQSDTGRDPVGYL